MPLKGRQGKGGKLWFVLINFVQFFDIQNGNPTIAPSSGASVVRKVQIRRRGEEGNICGHHGDCGPGGHDEENVPSILSNCYRALLPVGFPFK